jgi:hypothetical protein
VFKVAAERVRETRNEKERLQRIVTDSEGAENLLRDLIEKRGRRQEALATATEQVVLLERLAVQAADRAAAAEQVRCAQEEVQRILKLSKDVEEAERKAKDLLAKEEEARTAVAVAQGEHLEADLALKAAEGVARAEGSDPTITDTVVSQELQLRKAAADQAAIVAQQRIDAATYAQRFVDAAAEAEREHREQEAMARSAQERSAHAEAKEKIANDELLRCDLLERAHDVRSADKEVADAQAAVEKKKDIQTRIDVVLRERATLIEGLSAMKIPQAAALGPMHRLANDLVAARGSLDVGFVVTGCACRDNGRGNVGLCCVRSGSSMVSFHRRALHRLAA